MSAQTTVFNRGAIRPLECFSQGWQLVKNDYWLMVGITLVGMLVGSVVPFGILMGPMMCGIHMCMFALARGEKPTFNLLFKGFDLFVPSLIATIVQMVPTFVLIVPAYLALVFITIGSSVALQSNGGPPPPEFAAAFFVGFAVFFVFVLAVALVVGVFFAFTYQLVTDRRLSGLDACKTSARAALANLGGTLGLLVLCMAVGVVGMLCCYVGAILALPVIFGALDVAYARVFPPIQPAAAPGAYPPPPQFPDYGAHYPPV
jgi:hypothetical protein